MSIKPCPNCPDEGDCASCGYPREVRTFLRNQSTCINCGADLEISAESLIPLRMTRWYAICTRKYRFMALLRRDDTSACTIESLTTR
jgi:hypothetical protein